MLVDFPLLFIVLAGYRAAVLSVCFVLQISDPVCRQNSINLVSLAEPTLENDFKNVLFIHVVMWPGYCQQSFACAIDETT